MVAVRFMLAFLVCGAYAAGASSQTITVVNTTQPGSADGPIDVFLKIEPIEKDAKLPSLTVQDVTGTDVPFQQIGAPIFLGRSDTKAYWRTSWRPDRQTAKLAPARVLYVRLGEVSDLLTITLAKPEAPQVTITGPAYALKLKDSREIAFRVVSSGKLAHVRPVFSTLVDEKTGLSISVDELSLENPATPQNAPNGGVTIDTSNEVVHLKVAEEFHKPGKFSGNVTLGSLEKPELGSFAVTVYSTSVWRKVLGGILLALGLFVYFGVAIWAKGRNKELLAALPARQLKEQTLSLRSIVLEAKKKSNVSFNNLLGSSQNSLDSVIDSLSITSLKSNGYLPQSFFSPFSVTDVSSTYATFLATVGNRLSALEVIVRLGVQTVLREWANLEKAGKLNVALDALQKLDDLADIKVSADDLKSGVAEEIRKVQVAVNPAVSFAAGGAPWTPIADMGSREITVQLQQLNKVVWLLWGAGTVFVGLLALVLFNDAFGSTQDCVQCLLWGIGMPAAAQGFGGLNAGSFTSALSVPVSR